MLDGNLVMDLVQLLDVLPTVIHGVIPVALNVLLVNTMLYVNNQVAKRVQ